jgi:phage major head subunit gpT-like protein
MAIIGRDKLLAASYGWHTAFNDQLSKASPKYEKISMVVPSDNPVEVYRWLNSVPQMEKWLGDRKIAKLAAEGMQIANEDWANGVELERDDLRDDKLGMVETRVRQCADTGPATINKAVFSLLDGAFSAAGGLTWDGQYLIDTDHTGSTEHGQGSQSNHGTAVLNEANFENALVQMMALKSDRSEQLDVFPKILVTGVTGATWKAARHLLQSDMNEAGTGKNLNENLVEHVWSQYITGPKWFLIDPRIPPIIVQIRQQAEFRAPVTDFDDFYAFMRKTLYYGADMTFGTGPAFWQGIFGSTGAG